jgi:uncharacterized protein (TIGR03083 family)
MMQPLAPVLVADLFPVLDAHLLALLAELTPEQWDEPTACAGWSVKDVVAHLLGGDLGNLSRRRDGLTNALAAYASPDADFADGPTLAAALNGWNGSWVAAARRLSPRVLRDLLATTLPATHAYYAGLDPYALGGAVSWAGPGPAPVWLDIAREYTEHWAHQAQIRDALGKLPPLDTPRLFAPVLATYLRALPHTLRDYAAPDGTALRVVITGAAGGAWVARRQGGAWLLDDAPMRTVQATATLDQDAAWRLFTRGLAGEAARRAVRLDGDETLAGAVLDMVAIIA